MDWKLIITDLRAAGFTQADIGELVGRSQAWISAVENEKYGDLNWSDGEALRKLHMSITHKEAA